MKEVLGDGMAECVHWRRGALAYMFTAVEANFQHELELCLIEGGLEQVCGPAHVRTRSSAIASRTVREHARDPREEIPGGCR